MVGFEVISMPTGQPSVRATDSSSLALPILAMDSSERSRRPLVAHPSRVSVRTAPTRRKTAASLGRRYRQAAAAGVCWAGCRRSAIMAR